MKQIRESGSWQKNPMKVKSLFAEKGDSRRAMQKRVQWDLAGTGVPLKELRDTTKKRDDEELLKPKSWTCNEFQEALKAGSLQSLQEVNGTRERPKYFL